APETIAEIIALLRDDASTRFIISSDLSHFLNYKQACERDRKTSDHIEARAFESIGYEDACGRNSINGLLYLARELDMQLRTVDVRNSGDTAGSRDRVVGYGAYGCYAR
ncbi:MAG: AmmeMemoRadiSam system protein B, partial [Leptospiraceae bacterium]|nr:AmmeMemoRadiSam system protein B [Leptospiraceae bacterium]